MKVRDVLADKADVIYSIAPEEPVLAALQMMSDHSIGALLVMNGEELLGVVSERDYARKIALMRRSSAETPVWQIMSTPVISVDLDTTVNTCMMLVTDKRIRHLPVVADTRVVGVLSIGDLVRAVIEAQEREIADLRRFIAS